MGLSSEIDASSVLKDAGMSRMTKSCDFVLDLGVISRAGDGDDSLSRRSLLEPSSSPRVNISSSHTSRRNFDITPELSDYRNFSPDITF
jgi:hypothetical protein